MGVERTTVALQHKEGVECSPVCITVYAGIMNTEIQCLQCGTDARKRIRLVLSVNKNLRRVADRRFAGLFGEYQCTLLVAVIRYRLGVPSNIVCTLAQKVILAQGSPCLLYTSPSPRDGLLSRMPSSA